MKKSVVILLMVLAGSACKNTWNEEYKQAFYQSCTEEQLKTGRTPEQAKTFCDCVFTKMEKKYPDAEEALEHIVDLSKDTDLIKCNDTGTAPTTGK